MKKPLGCSEVFSKLSSLKTFGIHWFRRDLRIAGNPALQLNFKKHQGKVLGVFCFDSQFLSREDFSHHRFAFFLKTLKALKTELQNAGGDLYVLDLLPDQAFEKLVLQIKKNKSLKLQTVSWNRDYEPFARTRDHKVKKP